MASQNLKNILADVLKNKQNEFRELQYQNSIIHMFFYRNLIEDHVFDLIDGATSKVLGRPLNSSEIKYLKAKAKSRTTSAITVSHVARAHKNNGYKVYQGPGQKANFEQKSGIKGISAKGGSLAKQKTTQKLVYIRLKAASDIVPMAIAGNADFVTATYPGGMQTARNDRDHRMVMRYLVQFIVDNVTKDMETNFKYLAGKGDKKRGSLTNRTKEGREFSATGTFARLHGPVSGASLDGTGPNMGVNEGEGDTSVAVTSITETLKNINRKVKQDSISHKVVQNFASQLDFYFSLNSTSISDIVKYDKQIELTLALGSRDTGKKAGTAQNLMDDSDADAVKDVVEKILQEIINNKDFSSEFKTSKGISQRFGELGSSLYLKNILSKKWFNKPNMRLKVNKELVKLGDSEKEMSKALHQAMVAGASKVINAKRPKGKKGSRRTKSTTSGRQKATTAKQSTNPMALKNLINSVLPQMVALRMNPPSLRYRTGRFANSARVTKVMEGPRGGLQADYTYMRNPYETFEPGGKQGSTMRDPRKIIGETIRDIVAQSMENRFIKTRRI